jgi:hypothetical protein
MAARYLQLVGSVSGLLFISPTARAYQIRVVSQVAIASAFFRVLTVVAVPLAIAFSLCK